ncbi:hypothetical protein AVEN_112632-1 [Araneus ventricosus]|uniref:Uncharacterized protein n=1 Tax=Araneus ventricosus TaxID=182803 RepID=A0A4Y2S4U8_ARAVE|nr:hypothetical protein AVEN_112632-1 [Araneus ventricosus]
MYNPKRRRELSPKLQQNWEGPYTVVKKLNDVVYRVQRTPNAKPKVIHINRLAPYRATDHNSISVSAAAMAGYQDLSDFERGVIMGAREMGHSISEVAMKFGFSRTTISRVYREYRVSGETSNFRISKDLEITGPLPSDANP